MSLNILHFQSIYFVEVEENKYYHKISKFLSLCMYYSCLNKKYICYLIFYHNICLDMSLNINRFHSIHCEENKYLHKFSNLILMYMFYSFRLNKKYIHQFQSIHYEENKYLHKFSNLFLMCMF